MRQTPFRFEDIACRSVKIEDVTFGYRQIGNGPDFVFIHGFPTHGYTWRKILTDLSANFNCHIFDLPGLGKSSWSRNTNFNIDEQARKVQLLLDKLSIDSYNLIAHNSGAAIARIVAINQPQKLKNLILINTEIPNHRPPFIEMYQRIGMLPLVPRFIRFQLGRERFRRSAMGFKQAYTNKRMFDDDSNLGPYLLPLIQSNKKTKGAFKFLKGIDWTIIDEFENTHSLIEANVLLLWGENDKTFPVKLAKKMADQFKSVMKFVSIQDASLLPHEEKPNDVIKEIITFVNEND